MVGRIASLICIALAWSASYTAGSLTMLPALSPLWLRTESTLNLTCVSDGQTEISWYKNNVKMNIDYSTGFMMTTRKTLVTTVSNLWKVDVRISDAGTYSCRDNQKPHLRQSIDIRVLNVVGSDVTKPIGHSATLKCNPQNLKHDDFKRIEWRREYGSLPAHQRSRVIKNDNSFSLQLTALDESDSGHYECIFTFETKTSDGLVQEMSLSKRIRLEVQGNPVITPEKTPVRILAPGTITLMCKVRGETNITWQFKKDNGNAVVIQAGGKYNMSIVKQSVSGGGMESISTLNVFNPTTSDQGQYSCSGKTKPNESDTKIVKVLQVEVTNANLTSGGTAFLRCEPKDLEAVEEEKIRFKWTVNNGADIENTRAIQHKINYTLELQNLQPKDAGKYECEFNFVDDSSVTPLVQPVNLYAPPTVEKFEKSKNMVQGDTLKLKCRVYGHPMPEVIWKKDEKEIVLESDERISVKDLEEEKVLISKNGVLTIFDLQFEDRANYKCEANNTLGSDNSTILVRVKDKLAALWPFLGIVAEVAILCLIIFIYERKRNKENEDEEDAPLQKTANAQDHKGKDEVRQRKP